MLLAIRARAGHQTEVLRCTPRGPENRARNNSAATSLSMTERCRSTHEDSTESCGDGGDLRAAAARGAGYNGTRTPAADARAVAERKSGEPACGRLVVHRPCGYRRSADEDVVRNSAFGDHVLRRHGWQALSRFVLL